ncbi:MAG TPA: nuclear transport factor 2 family protein [Burkholderiales bacterium]|jgi:ketosteroid isomerase-like protein
MVRAIKRVCFPTAQDAETAFYEAFERADFAAMMNVWAEDEEIACVHPGGPRLAGYEQVSKSWAAMFDDRERVRVHLTNQVYTQGMLLAVHSVHENILMSGEPKARPPIIATNVYIRTGDGWRMLMHHASAAPVPSGTIADALKILH